MAANSTESNITRQLIKGLLKPFDNARVLTKNVDRGIAQGRFGPDSGSIVDKKRSTDYRTVRTSQGNLNSINDSGIITGKANIVAQNYFSTKVSYSEAIQALELDELPKLLDPVGTRFANDFETDFAKFMRNNSGLLSGDVTKQVSTWKESRPRKKAMPPMPFYSGTISIRKA